MTKKRLSIFTAGMILAVLLTGCLSSPEEKIYEHLEKSVELESQFEKQQKLIVKAEAKEQELYNEIVQLPLEEYAKINKLSEEAIQLTKQREEYISKEKESVELAYEEFKKIVPLISKIENKSAKKEADKLETNVQKRYDTYLQLNQEYQKSLILDRQLYEMLQNKELTAEEFDSKLQKINEQYEKVIKKNEMFNKYTGLYNDTKQSFYKEANLNVTFEKNK